MYSLDCKWYTEEFPSIEGLIDAVLLGGMDPNYEITKDGTPTGEMLIDMIQY